MRVGIGAQITTIVVAFFAGCLAPGFVFVSLVETNETPSLAARIVATIVTPATIFPKEILFFPKYTLWGFSLINGAIYGLVAFLLVRLLEHFSSRRASSPPSF